MSPSRSGAVSTKLAVFAVLLLALVGCVRVGSRVCTTDQAGCDFTDHVMRIYPSGTLCATWDVDFAQYNSAGEPTPSFAVKPHDDALIQTLKTASENDRPVHVWYAGEQYVLQSTCSADYALVVYRAEVAP